MKARRKRDMSKIREHLLLIGLSISKKYLESLGIDSDTCKVKRKRGDWMNRMDEVAKWNKELRKKFEGRKIIKVEFSPEDPDPDEIEIIGNYSTQEYVLKIVLDNGKEFYIAPVEGWGFLREKIRG